MESLAMLLAQSVVFTLLIAAITGLTDEVEFEFDKQCYNKGDTAVLTAKYTGGGTEKWVNWFYEDRIAADNTIEKDLCDYDIGGADPGIPTMTYTCDTAQRIYKATVMNLPQTAFGKEWGVSFTLTGGSSSTPYKKQTLEQCSNNGLSEGAIAGIAVGAIVGVAVIVLIPVAYCFITNRACFG